jgi:hypothetical protein
LGIFIYSNWDVCLFEQLIDTRTGAEIFLSNPSNLIKLKKIMKKILLTLSCFISLNAISQSYKIVQNKVAAKYRIYITKNIKEANVLGYQVDSHTKVLKPGLIYFAVYKVNSADKADIIIYWVDSKEKAKWIK